MICFTMLFSRWNAGHLKSTYLIIEITHVRGIKAPLLGTGRLWVRCSAVVSLVPNARSSATWCSIIVLGPIRIIAKDVKSCTFCWYVRCVTVIVRVGGVHWPQTGAFLYHAYYNQRVCCLLGSMARFSLEFEATYINFVNKYWKKYELR